MSEKVNYLEGKVERCSITLAQRHKKNKKCKLTKVENCMPLLLPVAGVWPPIPRELISAPITYKSTNKGLTTCGNNKIQILPSFLLFLQQQLKNLIQRYIKAHQVKKKVIFSDAPEWGLEQCLHLDPQHWRSQEVHCEKLAPYDHEGH